MTLSPLIVFRNTKEALVVFGVLFFVFLINVGFSYNSYKEFLGSSSFHEGVVSLAYMKKSKYGKPYQVAKINTKEFTFYTTFWKKSLHVKSNDKIRLKIFSKNVTFTDFLSKRFYAPVFDVSTQKNTSFKNKLQAYIKSQHQNSQLGELYSALFLATPISKNMRQKIQKWGISHLVAISGFHLGVIYSALFFVLKMVYGFFHERFFPFRNIYFDLGIVIFIVLGFYMYLIDFTPSFLRAFVMSLLGFFFYFKYFKILSFLNLALAVGFILAFFPHLAFSIGFWFSVMGVFYIFLYFHHFTCKKWYDVIFLNIWVFLALVLPIHMWFPYATNGQFASIVLSIIFIPFYPLAFITHLVGYGGFMDTLLESFFNYPLKGVEIFTPLWSFIVFIILSLLAIFNRYLAIFCVSLGLLFFI